MYYLLTLFILLTFPTSAHAWSSHCFIEDMAGNCLQETNAPNSPNFQSYNTRTPPQPQPTVQFADQHPIISGLGWILLLWGPGIIGTIIFLFGLRFVIRFISS